MSAQHTPGPWKAHKIETGYGLPYTPVAAKTLIAKVYSQAFGDHEQSEANARLISAAPDLLAALEANLHHIPVDDADGMWKARAAILKAVQP